MQNSRITRKIDNSHIVWFRESNYWTQFEEPVWYIYNRFKSGLETGRISQKVSKRYHLNSEESKNFVNETIQEIQKLSSTTFIPPPDLQTSAFKSPAYFFSTRLYSINQKLFEISFFSRELEYIIHQSFAHLEIKTHRSPHYSMEMFTSGSSSILKISDKVWAEDNANLLKRRLFIEISGLLYKKTSKDWLTIIHGSAVSFGNESIILSTACGSGKSTMAALLCKEGLGFISDDYVPIDARFCMVYPFPAALSIKDGAYPILLPYFPQLKTAEVFHFKGTDKTVRYLPLTLENNIYKPLPVKTLIFIQFNPSTSFSFRKVPPLEALKRFNEEAWISHSPSHARKFIKWFPMLNCYELEYSDNEQAINAILSLFSGPIAKNHHR